MGTTSFPLIKELTLDDITINCKNEFGINKTDFEYAVFNTGGWLTRIRRGKSKMDNHHYRNMFQLLKDECKKNSYTFISTLKKWYPSLAPYDDEETLKRIIKDSIEYNSPKNSRQVSDANARMNSKEFLKACLENDSPITHFKMAAHTGWIWFDDRERNEILVHLAENNVNIQIIANSTSVIEPIAKAFRDPSLSLRYNAIDDNLASWNKYSNAYPNIQFRVADYPVLRALSIVTFEDGTSRALTIDYVYGSYVHNNEGDCIASSDPRLSSYAQEFDFLWKNSQTFEDWKANAPREEEILPPGNYILMHPFHNPQETSETKLVYSTLSILENNEAVLKVNCIDSLEQLDSVPYSEYSYRGDVKVTRNYIYISLYDGYEEKKISLSLVRAPFRINNRLIGIMTGILPSGTSLIALKCACIKRSDLSTINMQELCKLLSYNSKQSEDYLLEISQQDINSFYSEHIFTEKKQ